MTNSKEQSFVVTLKKNSKMPVKERIKELKNQGLNEDASIIIALGERNE
jgi:hypothetical protein